MRSVSILYYVTTSLVSLMMIYSGITYFFDPAIDAAFTHLGFPPYFRIELAIGKLIGVALLWLPVASWIREWAYASFFIVFVSALVAHSVSGDPAMAKVMPIVFLVLHLTSYLTYRMLKNAADNRDPHF